jgi:uncharacterized phage protein (TIGR02216 family)
VVENSMPRDDPWDWPLLLYVGTVILKMSEGKFWRITPRKLNILAETHVRLNTPKSDKNTKFSGKVTQVGYIDQIF